MPVVSTFITRELLSKEGGGHCNNSFPSNPPRQQLMVPLIIALYYYYTHSLKILIIVELSIDMEIVHLEPIAANKLGC